MRSVELLAHGKPRLQDPMRACLVAFASFCSLVDCNRIRITTTSPNKPVLEGTLFTTCPLTNLVAISTTPSNFRVLPISTIQTFTLTSAPSSANGTAPFTNAIPPLAPLNTAALSARADAAVARLKEAEARKGKGVGKEAQDLFDALAKSLPARWDGANMVINDAVVIVAPYRAEDCRVGQGQPKEMLARVKKIVSLPVKERLHLGIALLI